MDLVNVGGLGVSVAGILLSSELSMIRVFELDQKSFDRFPRLFYSNQNSTAAIGEPVQGVNIVHQDNFAPNLQLQLRQEGGVLDTACLVGVESFDRPAGILGLDCEEFSTNLI